MLFLVPQLNRKLLLLFIVHFRFDDHENLLPSAVTSLFIPFFHLQTCWTTQTSTGSPPTAKCATMFSIQEKTTDASSVFLIWLQTAFLKGGLLASNSHTELCQPLSPCLNNRISPSPSAEILPVLVPTANRSIESGGGCVSPSMNLPSATCTHHFKDVVPTDDFTHGWMISLNTAAF